MVETDRFKVKSTASVKDAIKTLDGGGIGIVIVVADSEAVVGIVTDGDFRRSVLNGVSLNASVMQIANRDFKFIARGYSKSDVVDFFKKEVSVEHLLVLEDGKLHEIILKNEPDALPVRRARLDTPVVIMAGGKGTRLDPFTRILPKPLIPIGDKTIIELIMDKYMEYGIDRFIISVNYKAKMIKTYLEDDQTGYQITYIDETEPLGTAGSLKCLENLFTRAFFVANCDVIIEGDYSKIFQYHCDGNFDLTMVASLKSYVIPYGVCEIDKQGTLCRLNEKPESNFLVNTGMYVLSPGILKFIPKDQVFHMTDLIARLQREGLKVGVYPVSEDSWIDIGQWELYKSAINLFNRNR